MRTLLIATLVLLSCATPSSSIKDGGDAGPSQVSIGDAGATLTQVGPNSFVVEPLVRDAGTALDAGTPDAGSPRPDGGIVLESSSKKVRRPLSK
jgi:hypothetical protein